MDYEIVKVEYPDYYIKSPINLKIFTGNFDYFGTDRLIIDHKNGHPVFSPKKENTTSEEYLKQMYDSFQTFNNFWNDILTRKTIVFISTNNYKYILSEIFKNLGAIYFGDINN